MRVRLALAGSRGCSAAEDLANLLDFRAGRALVRNRRFYIRQSRISIDVNILPDTFPGLDCRRVRPQMNRLFRNGLGRIGWSRGMLEPLPGSRLRSFMLSSNGLPGLDPRMLSPASLPGRIGSGGGIRRRFSLRKIGEGNRFRLRTPVPAASFLLQQLFNAALRPTGPAPGGILNPVATVIIPLTPLAGLPELAMEPFRSIVQPTAQKLPGGGRRPLLQALFARLFLFDFVDLRSPPGREKGPRLRPFSAKSGCIYSTCPNRTAADHLIRKRMTDLPLTYGYSRIFGIHT